jgi:fibronectin type 3 domain-containing protein
MRLLLTNIVTAVMLFLGWGVTTPCSALEISLGSVTLTWNPSTSPGIASYNIYAGSASSVYTNKISVRGSTNVVITGLIPGAMYYFTSTAVNITGSESQFSNEIAISVPTNQISASLAAENPPASGEFALSVNGRAGCNYVVQVSSNLAGWTSIETNTAPFTFVDVNASQFSQRFYRAIYLP